MSFKDFISNNIIDLGESKKSAPVKSVQQEHRTAKSFINPGSTGITYSDPMNSQSNFGSQITTSAIANTTVSIAHDDLEAAREQIVHLLDSKNQPGIDLHEFVVAKNGMSAIPVEADRYKIAYSSLSPIGLTKEILNSSGTYYISVVDNELKSFQDQFAKVNKSDVDDKKAAIEAKKQQMSQLADQINKLNEDIKTMSNEVADSESTLNSKNYAFVQAANEAKATIQTELDKINQYIQ